MAADESMDRRVAILAFPWLVWDVLVYVKRDKFDVDALMRKRKETSLVEVVMPCA